MDAVKHAIEPQFLAGALARGVTVRIGQMNKTEHEGILREIGRYEINLEERGAIVTVLKQDISFILSPTVLVPPSPAPAAEESTAAPRPNVQQDFLDKAIRERHHLTLFLLTGQRIRAILDDYDNFTLLVSDGERQHLYYKHGISTINR